MNGKRMVYAWTPDLEDAVKRAKAIKRWIGSFYLFATQTGQPYSESGFDSIWQRCMRRALKDGVLKERFREHDIRATSAAHGSFWNAILPTTYAPYILNLGKRCK